ELEYKPGRRLNTFYNSEVNIPTVNQILPVVNNINPLFIYYGNPDLIPEYNHEFNLHWWIFDQFTFTTLMTSINSGFTKDKINWSHTINDNLLQTSTLVNTDQEFNLGGNVDYSTAITKLGIKINADIEESWNTGINYVNTIENKNSNRSHRFYFSAENRKKNKWDIISGIGYNLTHSRYSIQKSLNRDYSDLSWFGEIRYNPTEKWNFELTADVTNYSSKGFNETVNIPLLGAEMSYYFLKHNRGVLSISCFDLLDKNTLVQRTSELNYLREIQSNTIGRYIMISFKYRLNKFGEQGGGIDVDIKRR
ncbi:outer membrane beta-barrel protein, partial [Bacteroidota bacterium]